VYVQSCKLRYNQTKLVADYRRRIGHACSLSKCVGAVWYFCFACVSVTPHVVLHI